MVAPKDLAASSLASEMSSAMMRLPPASAAPTLFKPTPPVPSPPRRRGLPGGSAPRPVTTPRRSRRCQGIVLGDRDDLGLVDHDILGEGAGPQALLDLRAVAAVDRAPVVQRHRTLAHVGVALVVVEALAAGPQKGHQDRTPAGLGHARSGFPTTPAASWPKTAGSVPPQAPSM